MCDEGIHDDRIKGIKTVDQETTSHCKTPADYRRRGGGETELKDVPAVGCSVGGFLDSGALTAVHTEP